MPPAAPAPSPVPVPVPAPAPSTVHAAPPLDLPRLVMRRASVLGALVLLLALLLGLGRMDQDIGDEVDAAMSLAGTMARLGQLAQTDDRSALASLAALQAENPLRHLALQVHAQDGSLLLGPPPPAPAPAALRWLLQWHQHWMSAADARRVAWTVPRADGRRWTVSLAASHDSERREAMTNLLATLGLLLLGVAGLLAVMHWNLRRAFAPLGRLLQAIAGIEGHDARQVQTLPTMPTRELESLAAALRHLGAALDQAETQRRQLSQQMLTLQEDERARLARDLHDEFGQRLTALRVDAAWLARRLAGDAALLPVVDGMAQQCALVQQDIRALLTRLQPFGPQASGGSAGAAAGAGAAETLASGVALLQALVDSWQGSGHEPGLACALDLAWHGADGRAQPWPDAAAAQALWLPQALWLTVYRISQEALTNSARHADARAAGLRLHCSGGQRPGDVLRLDWQAWDDGVGIGLPCADPVLPRGNGLAGLQQRVWAQGGALHCAPVQPGAARPGLRLSAGFDARLLPPPGTSA